MKNLKKLLAVVLVVAMVLGIGAISASAAFPDTTGNKYSEAIDVMSGIGVINGVPGGNFDPTGSLTREQAAKIIAYMLLGPVNAELISTATSQKFSDVSPSRWSAGYIEYCANAGIIVGPGDGTFNPAGTLTTAAFTKMLLVALGYNAGIEGLTGNSWVNNTAALAVSSGVNTVGIAISGTTVCTREQAAQLAFKAMTANTVRYTGGSTITVGGTTITTGATRSDVPGATGGTSNYNFAPGDGIAQFCETHFPLLRLVTSSFDANGLAGHKWQSNSKDISGVYNSAILLASSNNGTSWARLTNVNDVGYIGFKPDTGGVAYYLNGNTSTDAAVQALAADAGKILSFYDTDFDGLYDSVCATVKSFVKLAAAPVTGTNTAGDATVTISSLAKYNVLASTVSGYEGLAKGDYVLYWTSAASGVTYMEKAASVSGVVSGFSSTFGVKVDNAYHADSKLDGTAFPGYTTDDYQNSYTFYLDNSGAVIAAVQSTAVAAANLVILSSAVYTAGNGVTSFDGVQGKIIKPDGTTAVVSIYSINGGTAVTSGTGYATIKAADGNNATFYNVWTEATQSWGGWTAVGVDTCGATLFQVATSNAGANAKTYFGIAATVAGNSAFTGRFYYFSTLPTGAYALTTTPPAGYSFAALADEKITMNTPAFDGASVGNDTTVFIYETVGAGGVPVYTVYTGIANVPTTTDKPTNKTITRTIIKDAAGIAKYVYAVVGTTTSAISDVIYFPFGSHSTTYENGVLYYEKYGVVNGVVNTAVRVPAGQEGISGVWTSTNKSAAGVYTLVDAAGDVKTGIASNSGNVLVAGGAGYVYNSSTKAYYINTLGVVQELTGDAIVLSAIDTVYAKLIPGTSTASVIYVMQKTAAPTAVTLAKVTAALTEVDTNLIDGTPGSITGWSAATDTVTVTVTAPANCTVSSLTINGVAYTSGANYAVAATGTYTVQMILTDNYSGAVYTANTYTFTVAA